MVLKFAVLVDETRTVSLNIFHGWMLLLSHVVQTWVWSQFFTALVLVQSSSSSCVWTVELSEPSGSNKISAL